MSSESTIQDYLRYITTAFSSKNNEERKQAEFDLIKKCTENPQQLEYIIGIISQTNEPDIVKEFAGLFISTAIKKLVTMHQQYEMVQQMKHSELLLSILKQQNLNIKIKGHITVSFSILFSYDRKNQLRPVFEKHCKELFENNVSIHAACYLFDSLINSLDLNNLDITNVDWINEFIKKGKDISLAFSQVPLTNKENFQEMQNSKLQIYQLWTQNCDQMCRKFLKTKKIAKLDMMKVQNLLLMNESLNTSLQQCLFVQIGQGQQETTQIKTMISCLGDQQLDNMINESKNCVLNCYNYILNTLLTARTKSEMKLSPFHNSLNHFLPTTIICLIKYVSDPSFDLHQSLKDMHISNIVNNQMKIITYCGGQTEFYQIFSESKASLFIDVIYPFISTSQKEYHFMTEEPEEFVNLALDTVDKQQSDIPKTTAAQMLEMLCDHIDGSTTFITQIAIAIIKQGIQGGEEFNFLKDLKQRYLFTKMDNLARIEASFMILTVISYLLSRRKDLIQLMEEMLKSNKSYFESGQLNPLISARLSLFIGYYCDNIFKTDDHNSSFVEYFELLVRQLQCKEQYRFAIMYQSIDALKNIVEDEDLLSKIKLLIIQVFPVLLQPLLESKYDQHFDMILSILKIYAHQIKENQQIFKMVLDILVKRVIIEQQNIQEGQKENQLWINKSWNIIRALPEIDAYSSLLPVIEQSVLPLYQMLEFPALVEFDEDIFLLVSQLIEKSKTVTEPQMKLLLLLGPVHEKQKYRLGQMYEMLNFYIIYGKQMFADFNAQKIFFEVCFKTISQKNDVINLADQAEGLLLLHLAIQELGSAIDIQNLKTIFQAIITLINQLNQEGTQDFMKSRLLGVFLSAFLTDFERTKTMLLELQLLQSLFKMLIENPDIHEEGYGIKLFIISMCYLIKNHQLAQEQFIGMLIDVMVNNLNRQQQMETKKANKKEIQEDEDEDLFEDEDSEEFYNEEKQEAQLSLESFKSQVTKENEFGIFKDTMLYLKNKYTNVNNRVISYPNKIQLLKEELHPSKIQFIQDIMLFNRIKEEEGFSAPRKVLILIYINIYQQIINIKQRKRIN